MNKKWLPYAIAAVGAGLSIKGVSTDDEGKLSVVTRPPAMAAIDAIAKVRPRKSQFLLGNPHGEVIVTTPVIPGPMTGQDGEGLMGQTTLPKTFKVKPITVLNPHRGGNMQCAFPGWNEDEWFLTITTSEPVHEDQSTYIERHVKGEYQDECFIRRAGHPMSTGALGPSNEIWTRYKNECVRFAYTPGTIAPGKMRKVELWTRGGAQVSFSPSRKYVVVWDRSGNKFTRRRVADILKGINDPLGKTISVVSPRGHAFQGFGLVRDSLFMSYGTSNQKAFTREFSFETGKRIGPDYIWTNLGRDIVGGKHEAESAPGRYLMNKVGQGAKRRLVIGEHNL